MEELIGTKVKIMLDNRSGIVAITGEVLKIDNDFVLLSTPQKNIYISINNIKTIEKVSG